MVNKGNHPQMALIQVCELFQFTQIKGLLWERQSRVLSFGVLVYINLSVSTTSITIGALSKKTNKVSLSHIEPKNMCSRDTGNQGFFLIK